MKQIYKIYPITSPNRPYYIAHDDRQAAVAKWKAWWFKDKQRVPMTIIIETEWVQQI